MLAHWRLGFGDYIEQYGCRGTPLGWMPQGQAEVSRKMENRQERDPGKS